ncbi:MAG: hypothetical protein AAF715_07105 [Myxococcota bacterium]
MSEDDFVHLEHRQSGKLLRIHVPNYLYKTEGPSFDSYLRLGASRDDRAEPGEPLARMFPADTYFVDDIDHRRKRDGAPFSYTNESESDRKLETDKLHDGVGWRDHTDGNRVSTTMGDKVEVIGGNYRLIVLGRQYRHGELPRDQEGLASALSDSCGIDMSGGIIRQPQRTPGATWREHWRPMDFGGTWQVYTHTRDGHLLDVFHGRQESYTYADRIESTTGWGPGAPTPPHDDLQPPEKLNPTVVSKSWLTATQDETHIAEGTTSVLNIGAGTAATTVIGLGTVEQTTIGGGTMSTTQIGGGTVDNTVIGAGAVSSTIVAGATFSLNTATAAMSIDLIGAEFGLKLYGAGVTITAATSQTDINVTGMVMSVSAGVKFGLHLGVDESVCLPKDSKTKLSESIKLSQYEMVSILATFSGGDYTFNTMTFKVKAPSIMLG